MDLYGVNELFDTYFQSMLHLPGHQYWWLSFLRKKNLILSLDYDYI